MRAFKALLLAGNLMFASTAFPQQEAPQEVLLPIDNIYAIPTGFDSNDAVEIAVLGYLPNSCYKLGKGSAKVDLAQRQITLKVDGYLKSASVCIPLLTPFLEVIQVGLLPAGQYQVRAFSRPNINTQLEIKLASTPEADDYLYAPVDTVELVPANHIMGAGSQQLLLKGTYPYMYDGCMRVTAVKTYYASNDVLVVQPISEIFKNEACNPNDTDSLNRFTIVQPMPTPVSGKSLIHVRTLNGRAVNKFVDLTMLDLTTHMRTSP